jgi:hypothetical protein
VIYEYSLRFSVVFVHFYGMLICIEEYLGRKKYIQAYYYNRFAVAMTIASKEFLYVSELIISSRKEHETSDHTRWR